MAKREIKLDQPIVVKGVHPGEILRDELEARNLTQTAFAQHLEIHPKVINEICQGRRGISAEMAIKFSKAFSTSTSLWIGLQKDFELSQYDESKYDYIQSLSA